MKNQKAFFFLSFLPAFAYWYLEANYSLQIALIGGVILAVIEMAAEWIFTKHVHTISKLNFYLIVGLGGMSLLASEGIWFKLQPAFTGWVVGSYLCYRCWRQDSLMVGMLEQMGAASLPRPVLELAERNLGIFMVIYGSFMAAVAVLGSTGQWLFWKTGGFYLASFVFTIGQAIFIRYQTKEKAQ